ncbi:hypothetical protein [Parasediminibacterium sp. JCM 36343]|uniref:hypothetical protein n=1 Tax=Parasediminibacterium sp. JCM 36343 TaxID=3374279 RepID=UPI00397DF2AA
MNLALKNITSKVLMILLSFLIINQSIDEIDFQPLLTIASIGNFNDLNSAIEYVSEIILGHKDVFPEFQQNGRHKQTAAHKHTNPKIIQPVAVTLPSKEFVANISFAYPLDEKYSFLFSKEITQPPSLA